MRKFLKILFLPFGLILIAIVAILRIVLRPIAALANISSILLIFTGVIGIFFEIKGSSIADYSNLYKWLTLAFCLSISIFGLILPFIASGVLGFAEFVLKQITLFTFDFSSKKERDLLRLTEKLQKSDYRSGDLSKEEVERQKTDDFVETIKQAQKQGIAVEFNLPDLSEEESKRLTDNNPANLNLDGPFSRIVSAGLQISPETAHYIKSRYSGNPNYNKAKLMLLSFAKEFSKRNPLYMITEHFYTRPSISSQALEAIFDCLELGVNPLDHIEETASNDSIILFRHSVIDDYISR